jgi:hypothetical protein
MWQFEIYLNSSLKINQKILANNVKHFQISRKYSKHS